MSSAGPDRPDSNDRPPRSAWGWRVGAALWLGAVLACAGVLVYRIQHGFHYETQLMALLPGDDARPIVTRAVDRMASAASHQVVILVGSDDVKVAGRAADACAAKLQGQPGIAHAVAKVDGAFADTARNFYLPFREGLLTPAQQARLSQATDEALVTRAVRQIYSPVGPPRLAPLEDDPLGLFSEAILDVASRSAMQVDGDRLVVRDGATTWVAVLVETSGDDGLSIGEQTALLHTFDVATEAAQAAGARTLRAGFVFHAAVAAHQGQHEMSTIGLGSLLGIVLLVLVVFRSFKPLALVVLPVAVGCVTAVGLSQLLFAKLHLLTFVFGTSIVGVAVDYGYLFVAGRIDDRPWDAPRRRREILPSVAMALATSLLAYAALATLPFPILRQMGVFTMLGLVAAWLTAVLWLPLLGARLPEVSKGGVRRFVVAARKRWPRVGQSRALHAGLAAAAVLSAVGIFRIQTNDDVRLLYAAVPDTVRQQQAVEHLMRLPEAGQFFLVTGDTEEQLLQRDEALSAKLDGMVRGGQLKGYESPSVYVPSMKRQRAARDLLWRRVDRPGGVADAMFAQLGSPGTGALTRQKAARDAALLTPQAWLASPVSTPFRSLWLGKTAKGYANVITLSGLQGDAALAQLKQDAQGLAGVDFIDHVRALNHLMGVFRKKMELLMWVGYAVVSAFLILRYRKRSWRVLSPTLLACVGTAGVFGLLGLNFNLFCVFGLLLSLDMGVDYGIYVQDRGAKHVDVALLCASLAAISTLLSFGLLALSHTPALRTFGLTVLLAISGSWLLAPCFLEKENA